MTESIANPIINSPFEPPAMHFEIGTRGPTGSILDGRRPSESFIPIARARKGRRAQDGTVQDALDFDLTGERREINSLINSLRADVALWRQRSYHGTTPTSRKLLEHWADSTREERVLFCQREAAETAIFLAEVAGRHNYRDWRRELAERNQVHNAGLPRVALKMATGSGKTIVMAMLIAWQTLNKVASPRDSRFAKKFLVVTPGITIRDRLRVLMPGDAGNYYDQRDLIPPDLKGALNQAQIIITNFHSFLLKDAKEIRGVSTNTRKMLLAGRSDDPFRESPAAMVSRVLRDFAGTGELRRSGEIIVFNDEAHHCYQDRLMQDVDPAKLTKDEAEANAEARVWFRGLQTVSKQVGIKMVYDLSATPFYLSGSGYNEGYIFPWTVSDFALMDAIESGIVKIPRTPVDDNSGNELVTYLRLWDYIGDKLPKRRNAVQLANWQLPDELLGALESLYRSYERAFARWQRELADLGEPPPVFIVVCPNTVVSKVLYDWIAGVPLEVDGVSLRRPGKLALFDNTDNGRPLPRPRTVLIDSAQLESGEPLSRDFKEAAAVEIELFKNEYRHRNPGADVDKLTDEDLLREVMNTVGKRGRLGGEVRCVISVAMLTEGWDANTVSHILGIRAFRSQLLCEQVIGRGLRRRSYAVNEQGRFDPEYANVYGVPFQFLPTDRPIPEVNPKLPALHVHSVPGREQYRITFPKLDGYRLEMPDNSVHFDAEAAGKYVIGPGTVPTWVESAPLVGESEFVQDSDIVDLRKQRFAFDIAKRLLDTEYFNPQGQNRKLWLYPRLVQIAREWLLTCVQVTPGYDLGVLGHAERQGEAAERILRAITQTGDRRTLLRPMLRRFNPVGSTADVSFLTRKVTSESSISEVSHVTLDGQGGNTWEQILALECERSDSRVAAYVKNDHLGFAIPYVHRLVSHSYFPDFLVRLERAPGEEVDRTLIVEVSGSRKSAGPTRVKAETARDSWCSAVNNHGGFGRWGYVEIRSMVGVRRVLREAIDNLYAGLPIMGDPDLMDDFTDEGHARGA